jgi:hypothetical protein
MVLAPGAKPLEPFGKGSNALKAEARDAGLFQALPVRDRPSVQLPTGIADGARYRGFSDDCKAG